MTFSLTTPMQEIEIRYPMAKTVLHAEFHVGGCSTCGYQPSDTLAEVAVKQGKDATKMLDLLNDGVQKMQASRLSVKEFAALRKTTPNDVYVLDVREPWEFDLVHFAEAHLVNAENLESLLLAAREKPHVIVTCHHGIRSMNAALFFQAHGVPHARSLSGGIDAYSLEEDAALPRY